ncbi:unnamed protein product [Victoria cruziana]
MAASVISSKLGHIRSTSSSILCRVVALMILQLQVLQYSVQEREKGKVPKNCSEADAICDMYFFKARM